jgi:hypothetical protein
MQLIYRAQTFRYVARPSVLMHKPRAVNWRHQVADHTDHPPFRPVQNFREARALNWRFQMVLEG